jgi:hypothetical protein
MEIGGGLSRGHLPNHRRLLNFSCPVGTEKPAIQSSWISQRKLPAREDAMRLEPVNPKTVDSILWPPPRPTAKRL